MMKNTAESRDRQKGDRNPGHRLGDFLIQHSNSPEYLVSQLEAYLEAVRADLEDERRFFQGLLGGTDKGKGA
jgi:hypothetical protein